MAEECRQSIMAPNFKQKGSQLACTNCRAIKPLCHTFKIWERILETPFRRIVTILDKQIGFIPGRFTMDAVFALRILKKKYHEKGRALNMVFVDLKKAFDRVLRKLIWSSLRRRKFTEAYVEVFQDMYKRTKLQDMYKRTKTVI